MTSLGESLVGATGAAVFDESNVLRSAGSEQAVPLQMFDERAVLEACRAAGWDFALNSLG